MLLVPSFSGRDSNKLLTLQLECVTNNKPSHKCYFSVFKKSVVFGTGPEFHLLLNRRIKGKGFLHICKMHGLEDLHERQYAELHC